MKKNNKILCLLLSLIMLLSLIPATAFAATVYYKLSVQVDNAVIPGGNVKIAEKQGEGTYVFEKDIASGLTRTVNFYPAAGYEIDSVTVNDAPVTVTSNQLELTMDTDKTVVVKFKRSNANAGVASFWVTKEEPVNSTDPININGVAYVGLGGATFTLADASGTIYSAQSADTNGIAVFNNIPNGEYTLSETTAPNGYTKSDVQYTVKIDTANPVVRSSESYVITFTKIGTTPEEATYFNDGDWTVAFINIKDNWDGDGIYHWPQGNEKDKDEHKDSNNDGICDICSFNMPGGSSHNHSGGNWKSDGIKHWKECPCGEILDEAAHEDKNNDNECDDCGHNMLPVEVPQTGDDSNPLLYGVLMLLALAGIAGTTVISKREKA